MGDVARKHGVKFHGYADDAQFYLRFSPRDSRSLLNAIRTLGKCIDEVKKWMLANKLKLNDSKTEFIVFVNKHNQSFIQDRSLVLMVGETGIPPKMKVRNLGVIFDTESSMMPFINNTVSTCYFHLKTISLIKNNLTQEACAAAVRAMILSILDYANSLLVGAPEGMLDKLHVVQNNAAQVIHRSLDVIILLLS